MGSEVDSGDTPGVGSGREFSERELTHGIRDPARRSPVGTGHEALIERVPLTPNPLSREGGEDTRERYDFVFPKIGAKSGPDTHF
jgi:hypothetical protein